MCVTQSKESMALLGRDLSSGASVLSSSSGEFRNCTYVCSNRGRHIFTYSLELYAAHCENSSEVKLLLLVCVCVCVLKNWPYNLCVFGMTHAIINPFLDGSSSVSI